MRLPPRLREKPDTQPAFGGGGLVLSSLLGGKDAAGLLGMAYKLPPMVETWEHRAARFDGHAPGLGESTHGSAVMPVTALLLVCLAGASAGVWVAYLRWKDKRRPEPLAILILATVAGVASVGAALLGYGVLDGMGRAATWSTLTGPWRDAIPGALAIGLVEETAKLLPILPIALTSRHFDEIWDGPVYLGAAGIGFALAETLYLLAGGEVGTLDGIVRAVIAPITHALFAAPTGLGLAYAVLYRRWWALPLGLGVASLAHGAYDLFLAQPGLQPAASAVVGVLWIWLLFAARDLVQRAPVKR